MRLFSWLLKTLDGGHATSSIRTRSARCTAAPRCRPRFEPLEDRSLMTAGALDPTFGSGGIAKPAGSHFLGSAYDLAIYSNAHPATAGDIVAAGEVSVKGASEFGIVRYTPSGKPDPTFGNNGSVKTAFPSAFGSEAFDVAIQPDDKIVAAGVFYPSTGGSGIDFALARYKSNGRLDKSFGAGGTVITNLSGSPSAGSTDRAKSIFLQPDGKIVVAGETFIGATRANENIGLVRYKPNGALDPTFGSGGQVITSHTVIPGSYVDPAGITGRTFVASAVLQADGKFLVSGYTQVTNNTYEAFILRYTANGTLDTSFGAGGAVALPPQPDPDESLKGSAGKMALEPDGDIVMVGLNQLARLHADGSPDTTFAGGGTAPYGTGAPAIQPDGSIVTASIYGLVSRYLPDGTPDTTFGNGGTESPIPGSARALAIQTDGKILEACGFTIARLLPGEPEIGSFTASANTLTAAASVLLTAANITDSNPGSTATQVAFYAQVNGASTLLGYGTQTSPGTWTFTLSRPVDWSAGTYTISAEAKDNFGVVGEPMNLDLQVL